MEQLNNFYIKREKFFKEQLELEIKSNKHTQWSKKNQYIKLSFKYILSILEILYQIFRNKKIVENKELVKKYIRKCIVLVQELKNV